MSGFEIAGVVLGAIPLVISALEHYRAGKGVVVSLLKWNGQLDTLIERLKDQKLSFPLDILELLRGAGVEEAIGTDHVPEERCVTILQNVKNETEIREYFGPLHPNFLEILTRYEACLKAIVSKLKHIYRPPNAAEDDLAAISATNKAQQGSFAFKERVKFTIERGSLKELVEKLREDRLSLKTIIKGMETQREFIEKQPSNHAKRLAKLFSQIHTDATPLFAAVCKVCTCTCLRRHSVLMRLDNRVLPRNKKLRLAGKKRKQTTFNLILDFEDYLQEALVKTIQAEEAQIDDVEILDRDTVTNIPTIRFSTTNVKPILGNNDSPNKSLEVTNICHYASRTRLSGRVFALQLTNNGLRLLDGPSESRRDFSASMSLEKLLQDGVRDGNARMNPKQKAMLALDIAASVLQLRQTCWLDLPFNSKGIRFPMQLAGNMKTAILEPLVEKAMLDDLSKHNNAFESPDPKRILLELAILLLETWHDEPLELWMAKIGVSDTDSEEARRKAAVRWEEETEKYLPLHHLTVIDYCLGICGGRKRFWHDDEFLKQYCENVIMPLHESCKAFLDSSWYQTEITYVCNP